MATTYTSETLRNLFQSSFNLTDWYAFLLNFFHANELKQIPERILGGNAEDEGYYLGSIDTTDYFRIGLFQYRIRQGSVANKRVGLRNLVKPFLRYEFDAALVVFDSGDHWRFSFISDIKGEATSPKRYTYVFGNDELLYKTPIERFHYLQKKGISFENLKAAFSVEALSDEFFNKYRELYADFIQYVTGKRFVKVGSKWEEKKLSNPNPALMQAFGHDEKKIRDYIKKMMGRITFLHFLQRKGWMCGDLNYMQNLFERSWYKNDYLDSVLEPLFFGILNTKPAEREALFADYGWDKDLLEEWKNIPYLNGGLFERDEEDEPESVFPAEYFQRLFQFFSEYNFTIDENDPNDAEVGVDPEMLGKIFENLLEDNKDKGAFYTPKEIVRYMCQESLIAYLDTSTSIAGEKIRKFVLSPEEGVQDIPENKKAKLLSALEEVKICDPAIGSGAFPMGLLNELLHCREVLSGEHIHRAEIKKSIIQNNIYGVDIEKGAVDIARLRFWLSIVVDEDTPSPLPNLDYKIMQGNSLIESFQGVDLSELTYKRESKKDRGEVMLFDDEKNRLQKTVSQLLASYYSCSEHERKLRLRKQISDAINQQLEAQFVNSSILTKLKDIDLAGNNQFFLWHTWFSDVFNREDGKSGFDIVIGNPPYIDSETMVKVMPDEREMYSKSFKCAKGNWDIFIVFIEQALRLCSTSGVYTFIIPNKIIAAKYANELREYLSKTQIVEIRDYSRINVFVEAAVYPCTLLGVNRTMMEERLCTTFTTMTGITQVLSSNLVNKKEFQLCKFWDVYFRNSSTVSIILKYLQNKTIQDNNKLSVFGAATVSEAYLVKEFIFDKEQDENTFKVINTGTIDPYMSLWSVSPMQYIKGKYLYPRVKKSDVKNMNCTRHMQAESNKVIVAGMSSRIEAILDRGEYLAAKSTSIILSKDLEYLKFILAIINSSFISWVLNIVYNSLKMSGGYLNIGVRELSSITIPEVEYSQFEKLTHLVDKIVTIKNNNIYADINSIINDINGIVYQIYNLTDDEIEEIKSQTVI